MTRREKKKLALLRARAKGASYGQIAEAFGYENSNTARQALCLARRYFRARYPYLVPLELDDRRVAS